ncbi:MAG: PIG-L family deacetylase, partial [Muribaculaceae bacterium]|nr:PIG-L family deacetylase [Muribaculaceae bacterium]
MNTAIWIIIAAATAIIGYVVASVLARRNARSAANIIIDEAHREADVIKEKEILKAKEEETRKCAEVLGVKEVIYGGLPDMKLDTVSHIEINKVIEGAIDKIQPDTV